MENQLSDTSSSNRRKSAGTMSAERRKSHGRAAVTNGTELLSGISDERSVWVRRCKDLINLHTGDLGGLDNVSVAEASIIRRAAVMTVELEMLEAKFATAGAASAAELDLYVRASGNLRRLLETIGLQRRQRIVGGALVYEPDPLREQLKRNAKADAIA